MPHAKLKSENYVNFGGINTKTSNYVTGPQQFLDLRNLDFQTPGALTQRWGSTAYINQNIGRIWGVQEYNKTTGFSEMIAVGTGVSGLNLVYHNNALNTGWNTVGDVILMNREYTSQVGNIRPQYITTSVGGASGPWAYTFGGTSYYDFETYNNTLYGCNGIDFWKYNGATVMFFGLPYPYIGAGQTNPNLDTFYLNTTGGSGVANGFSGAYYYRAAYLNTDGSYGPAIDIKNNSFTFGRDTAGATYIEIVITPDHWFTNEGYGITAMAIFRNAVGTTAGLAYRELTFPYVLAALLPIGTTQFLDMSPNLSNPASGAGTNVTGLAGLGISTAPTSFQFGNWYAYEIPPEIDTFNGLSAEKLNPRIYPKYMEIYQNKMFLSGNDLAPSNVYFSELGKPEEIDVENFIEVRTNDGDLVRGLKSYLNSLYIFKTNSFHVLMGEDIDNFVLKEVSDEYGALSNRAIVVFKDFMAFLDRKGVILFNGANIQVLSTAIDPILERMNITAAIREAVGVHDKLRNQIMFGIPVDGSERNNLTIVYDYVADAWTTYDGYAPENYITATGKLTQKVEMHSNYSGLLLNVGQSFLSDNGTGFTCLVQTRYLTDMGKSTEKQFRRLWLDADPAPVGVTIPLTIDFYQNYGETMILERTMFMNRFQNRIDYGISAKSLGFILMKSSLVDTFRMHGFTIAYRYQRDV